MGSRGTYSFTAVQRQTIADEELDAFAVASLNVGTAKGTTPDKAIERFRQQLMNESVEYSAYLDSNGYFHALGSTGYEGETAIASLKTVAKEKAITTIVHNHPNGGLDNRKWGGPFSKEDLIVLAQKNATSSGQIKQMVATAREGIYKAKITKRVTSSQVEKAANKAEKSIENKIYWSEKGMWKLIHNACAKEFDRIGIKISFEKQRKKKGKLITQKIGTYEVD